MNDNDTEKLIVFPDGTALLSSAIMGISVNKASIFIHTKSGPGAEVEICISQPKRVAEAVCMALPYKQWKLEIE